MLSEILGQQGPALLERWIDTQTAASGDRPDRISPHELRDNSRELLRALEHATQSGSTDVQSPGWADVRHTLDALSAFRAERGFSPSDTARFVLSLKEAIFEQLRAAHANDPAALATRPWRRRACSTRSRFTRRRSSSAAATPSSRGSRKK